MGNNFPQESDYVAKSKPETDNIMEPQIPGFIDESPQQQLGFPMNFDYIIKHTIAAIKLQNNTLINVGEILTLVALPGVGKSTYIEYLVSIYLAKKLGIDIDSGGWDFDPRKKVLIIDSERTLDDCRRGLSRIAKRLKIDIDSEHFDSVTRNIQHFDFRCLIDIAKMEDRRKALEELVSSGEYGLVIIDGCLDFGSLNDQEIAQETVTWLRSLANTPEKEFAIITTIHPNKGTETIAGHLGAFLYRYSRAVLIIKNHETNPNIRLITNDFAQGKLSHGNKEIRELYTWDNELGLIMPISEEPTLAYKGLREVVIIDEVFKDFAAKQQSLIPSAILMKSVAEKMGKTLETAKKVIKGAVEIGKIEISGKGKATCYRLKGGTIDCIENSADLVDDSDNENMDI